MTSQEKILQPQLGLIDATMMVAGSMIGSGIFIVASDMIRNVGSAGWLVLLWLITGIVTVIGAISYGELAAQYPHAGGQYIYLKEAYSKRMGFLYGWSNFSVILTGTIAAVAIAFSKFLGFFFPIFSMNDDYIIFQIGNWLKIYPAQIVAILLIVILTFANTKGAKGGKLIQTFFTSIKIISLFGLIIFGLTVGFQKEIWENNWATGFQLSHTTLLKDNAGNPIGWSAFTQPHHIALVLGLISSSIAGALFSSVGWEIVTFLSSEVRNPKKNLGKALFLGSTAVIFIYILTNIMYLAVLPITPTASPTEPSYAIESTHNIAFALQDRVATETAHQIFGNIGGAIIAIMIMISTFGCNNGVIMSSSRMFYQMAKDGLFLKKAATLNKHHVPSWSLWVQCFWACILCVSGTFSILLDYIMFVMLLFYLLTIIGIFRLRKKYPHAHRPYKAWGYPYLQYLYLIVVGLIALGLLFFKWKTSVLGLIILSMGYPIYYFINKKKTVKNTTDH